MHRVQELVRLHRIHHRKPKSQRWSVHQIARSLKMSPNTERKYRQALEQAELLHGEPDQLPELGQLQQALAQHLPLPAQVPAQERSSLQAWRADIETMVERGAQPRAIYDRLCLEQESFEGSLSAVKRMVARIRKQQAVQPQDVVLHVDTPPGLVAQVDFGYIGKLRQAPGELLRKAYVFVMVLGFSRMMFAQVVFDQKLPTWLQLHRRAFEFFGAVPQTIVPDNLKSAVVRCYFEPQREPQLQRSYQEMARHYGFVVDPTPPFAPHLKGKVERGVQYIKGNFVTPRKLETLAETNEQLLEWLEQTANVRIHGSTGQRPAELFERDSQAMLALPRQPFEAATWSQAKVRQDAHVYFERCLYSVPFVYIGQQAWLRATTHQLEIFLEHQRVARHDRSSQGRMTNPLHLPQARLSLTQRDPQALVEQASQLSEVLGGFAARMLERQEGLSALRQLHLLLQLPEHYEMARVEAACQRAERFGNLQAAAVEAILAQGLEAQAQQGPQMVGKLAQPRFARGIEELLAGRGGHDGCA